MDDENVVDMDDVKATSAIEALRASIADTEEEIRLLGADTSMAPHMRVRRLAAAHKRLAQAQELLAKKEAQQAAASLVNNQGEVEEGEEAFEQMKESARFWLAANDLYWIIGAKTYMKWRPEGKWLPIQPAALSEDQPMMRNLKYRLAFDAVMTEQNRKFDNATFSLKFLDPQAVPLPYGTLNMMRPQFVARIDDGQPPHWIFRTLMESVGGLKQDNADHIEALIARKYTDPWDFMLPALVCENRDGGAGKSLLSVLMGTICGHHCVADNIAMRDLVGQFNHQVMGKLFIFVNETVEDRYDDMRLRQFLHSPTVWAEQKFMPRMQFENTCLVMIAGNNAGGAVKLAGNDIDRRVSVVQSDVKLNAVVAAHEGLSEEDGRLLIKKHLQYIILDPIEVGRWVDHIIKKWEHLPDVKGHHGADYDRFCEIQEPFWDELFTAVFTDPTFTHIRESTLFDIYAHLNKEKNNNYARVKHKTFTEHCLHFIRHNLPGQIERTLIFTPMVTGARDPMRCWAIANMPHTAPDSDSKYYYLSSNDGKVVWKFKLT